MTTEKATVMPTTTEQRRITDNQDPAVHHPKHYNLHPSGVECIDIVEYFTFNVGNAIKYCWRAGLKDATPNLQDLKKARWYLDREIGRLESEPTAARVQGATGPGACFTDADTARGALGLVTVSPLDASEDGGAQVTVWGPSDGQQVFMTPVDGVHRSIYSVSAQTDGPRCRVTLKRKGGATITEVPWSAKPYEAIVATSEQPILFEVTGPSLHRPAKVDILIAWRPLTKGDKP